MTHRLILVDIDVEWRRVVFGIWPTDFSRNTMGGNDGTGRQIELSEYPGRLGEHHGAEDIFSWAWGVSIYTILFGDILRCREDVPAAPRHLHSRAEGKRFRRCRPGRSKPELHKVAAP